MPQLLILRTVCLCSLGALGLALGAGRAAGADFVGSEFVTVRTSADPEYVARKAAMSGDKGETYIVTQGQFFDAEYRDASINKSTLGSILHFLAPTLTKQHYYPSKELKTTDLLLVVHWGETTAYVDDYTRTLNNLITLPRMSDAKLSDAAYLIEARKEGNDADAENEADQMAVAANDTARSLGANTAEGLLGFGKVLARERRKPVASDVQQMLEAELQEDRYFVILEAYDFQKLLKNEGRKLLWSAHMSMRAPGMNFTLALPRMGQVAADHYGENNDDIVFGQSGAGKNSSVEIGKIMVLSMDQKK